MCLPRCHTVEAAIARNDATERFMMKTTGRQGASHRSKQFSLSPVKRAIEAHVLTELRKSAYMPVQRVSCDFHEGILTLHGQVPSYHMKQIAQTVVLHLLNADMRIHNGLEVVSDCNHIA